MYQETVGYCRGGSSPGNAAGKKDFHDRNCRDRCDALPTCTGYNLPLDGSNWCETYTSPGASGQGHAGYKSTDITNGEFGN